jgi:hypothetical protein
MPLQMTAAHHALLDQIERLRQFRDGLLREGDEEKASLILLANVEMTTAIEAGFSCDEARMALALESITRFNVDG